MPDHKYQVTIKGGSGKDAPWITISGDTENDLAFNLRAFTGTQSPDSAELTAEAAIKLQNLWAIKDQLGGAAVQPGATGQPPAFTPQQQANVQQYQQSAAAPQQPQPPQPAQQAPAPVCKHGQMVYREAKPGSGKNWRAYFCPTPKDTPDQCSPQFLSDKQ